MKKIVLTLILTGFIFSVPTFAKTEIGGVTLPDTLKVGDETLVLNGGGIREKFWLDMYVGGLYLSQKETNSQKIIESDQPMAIFMEIVSGMITSERMIEAVEEGFQKSTGGNTSPIQRTLRRLSMPFKKNSGRRYLPDFLPCRGRHNCEKRKRNHQLRKFKIQTSPFWNLVRQ